MNTYKAKISKEEISELPVRAFEGKIHLIDKTKKAAEICNYLKNFKILGFDTETKPVFKKNRSNQVALLQLSTENEAFLFRLNKIGLPEAVTDILSNPKIIKTGVALRDDLKELRERNKFEPKGFVELQKFVTLYGIQDAGLKKLAANVLGFRISKSQQLSNWERRKLSEKQMQYAATDAWVGYLIYSKLKENIN